MGRLPIILGLACCGLLLINGQAAAQERITDQVAVTILRDQLYAATSAEGLVRVGLSSGERVLGSEARGINALVLTSIRLLGFSAQVQRWSEARTNLNEGIVERKVTPRLIMVRTDKRVFGFQGPFGRWKVEEFNLGEAPREMLVGEQVAVMLTDRRALGFSAFTGGFFPQDLATDEAVVETAINDNVAILSTPARRLIFRSQLGIWAELR
jgi:hypothetical protein